MRVPSALRFSHRKLTYCPASRGIDSLARACYSTYIRDAAPGNGKANSQEGAGAFEGSEQRTQDFRVDRSSVAIGGAARQRLKVAKLIDMMPMASRGCRHHSFNGVEGPKVEGRLLGVPCRTANA